MKKSQYTVSMFTDDVKTYLINTTGDSAITLQDFKDILESRVPPHIMYSIVCSWSLYSDDTKKSVAVDSIGAFHASRFITLVNYLLSRHVNQID